MLLGCESLNDSLRPPSLYAAGSSAKHYRLVRGQGKWDLTDVPGCESHSVALVPGVWLREEGGVGVEGARGVVISRQEFWRLQKRIVSFPPLPSSHASSRAFTSEPLFVSREGGGERFLARVLSTGRAFNEFSTISDGGKNAMFHTAAPVCRQPFLRGRGWKSSFSRPVDERTSPEIVYRNRLEEASFFDSRDSRELDSFKCFFFFY